MIYDCFTFFNELDLLDIRLHELNDVVDKFVIVEGTSTIQGLPKPLYYQDNRHFFEPFWSKIIYVVEDITPRPWDARHREREGAQRNAIMKGLTNCTDSDVIMISDIDEIPKAKTIATYQIKQGIMDLGMLLCYFYFNRVVPLPWTRAKILPYGSLRQSPPNAIRETNATNLPDAGWHFSYTGGPKKIKEKLQSFSHAEYNIPEYTDLIEITRKLEENKLVINPDVGTEFRVLPTIDLPVFVQQNLTRFKSYVLEK